MRSSCCLQRAGVVAIVAIASWLASPVAAQDLEPRSYSNAPIGLNFAVASYAYSSGGVAVDASLPITDGDVDVHSMLFAYARVFEVLGQSAKLDVVVPYAWLSGSAKFNGREFERNIDGFGDPRMRFSLNLLGAPALSLEEFKHYEQDLIVGTSLQVTVPLGQYDDDKAVNLGTNRFSIKPELGVSKAWGPFIFETAFSGTFYSDNDAFLGMTRSQAPLYSLQTHLVYHITRFIWAAVDGTFYGGGNTTLDGKEADDRQQNSRVGGTLAFPITRNVSIKLYGSYGVSARIGSNFSTGGIAWQVRWGAGL